MKTPKTDNAVPRREQQFWDDAAREVGATLNPEDYRVAVTDRHDGAMSWLPYLDYPALMNCLLTIIGNVHGKTVLDLGTGTGFLAVLLALQGAKVIAVDLSEEQLAIARFRARVNNVENEILFRHGTTEELPVADNSIDVITGSFVLHHTDLESTAREIRRVLIPGGKAAFIETSGRNPILVFCRNYLAGRFGIPKYGSDDERPLGVDAQHILERLFPAAAHLHYPMMMCFRLLTAHIALFRISPLAAMTKLLDHSAHRVCWLRPYSYYLVVELHKPLDA